MLETKWLLKLNGDYSSEDSSDDADYKLDYGDGFLGAEQSLAVQFPKAVSKQAIQMR